MLSQVSFEKEHIQFTISLGVSTFKKNDNQHSFISKADKAMYTAKLSGKNQVITS